MLLLLLYSAVVPPSTSSRLTCKRTLIRTKQKRYRPSHLQTAEVVATLTGHTGQVNCIKWLPKTGEHPFMVQCQAPPQSCCHSVLRCNCGPCFALEQHHCELIRQVSCQSPRLRWKLKVPAGSAVVPAAATTSMLHSVRNQDFSYEIEISDGRRCLCVTCLLQCKWQEVQYCCLVLLTTQSVYGASLAASTRFPGHVSHCCR